LVSGASCEAATRAEVEEFFIQAAHAAVLLIEAAAVLVVSFGSLEALFKLLVVMAKPGASHGMRKAIWRRFGVWLLLGLEFALAADIITSVISPTWEDIGELGAIAVIRTFLNYFLEHDLENAETAAERAQSPVPSTERTRELAADSVR
jgi:uncharacterized membrane protein